MHANAAHKGCRVCAFYMLSAASDAVIGYLPVDTGRVHICALGVLVEDTLFLSSCAGFIKLNLSRAVPS